MLLSKGANLEIKDTHCRDTAFHKAIEPKSGSESIIRLLAKNGANIDAQNKNRLTALCVAVCYGEKSVVQLLICFGAAVNTMDKYGATALHYAVDRNNLAIVRTLLKAGADIDAKDSNGNTPLLRNIIRYDNKDHAEWVMVRLLLEKGATPNIRNNASYTALTIRRKGRAKKPTIKLLEEYENKAKSRGGIKNGI